MTQPLRICLIGAGRAGAVHALNLHERVHDARVVAVVDGERDRAVELAARVGGAAVHTDAAEAIAATGLDAVVIATPTPSHRDLAVLAAGAGLHVFCEKPMALDVAECDDMRAAAERSGTLLQLGFVRRFQPEFAEAKARIEAGEIGEPMVVKSLTRGPGLPPAWAHDIASSNGMLAEVNSHDFDCVRWLAGSEITRVYAEVANRKGAALGVTAEHFYDNAVVSLRFASDAVGTIDGTCPAEYGYDARVEVVGTRGLLTIGEVQGMPLLSCTDRDRGGLRPVHRTWPDRFDWGYLNEITAFAGAARSGVSAGAGAADGRAAVAAVVASNRSWLEARPVEIEGARA
jgi:predicted dehydrogenase